MARPRKIDDDTRTALIRDAAEMIAAGGTESVSLRPLAARYGCSTTVLYTMFGSRDGLISAVRKEAVASFVQAQEAVFVVGDPAKDLLTLGRAYRCWALKFPTLYGVMFGRASVASGVQGSGAQTLQRRPDNPPRAMRPLHDRVKQCVAAGIFRDHPLDEICGSIRAGVHGWVTLEVNYPVVPGMDGDEAYEQHMLSLMAAWSPSGVLRG